MKQSVLVALVSLPVAGVGAQSLTTTFAGGNDFAGNMFNVTLGASALRFTGMDVHIGQTQGPPGGGAGTSAQITLYTRIGSYVGFENNAAGWTSRGTYNVTAAGNGSPTFVNFTDFDLLAGGTTGFYVTISDYNLARNTLIYSNGNNSYSNADLTINTGIAKGDPDFTGLTFTSRTWNGTLYYTPATVVPEPSTYALLATGLAALVGVSSRRRRR
jgi:hypothetical protein